MASPIIRFHPYGSDSFGQKSVKWLLCFWEWEFILGPLDCSHRPSSCIDLFFMLPNSYSVAEKVKITDWNVYSFWLLPFLWFGFGWVHSFTQSVWETHWNSVTSHLGAPQKNGIGFLPKCYHVYSSLALCVACTSLLCLTAFFSQSSHGSQEVVSSCCRRQCSVVPKKYWSVQSSLPAVLWWKSPWYLKWHWQTVNKYCNCTLSLLKYTITHTVNTQWNFNPL